jgi:hypothetical protein
MKKKVAAGIGGWWWVIDEEVLSFCGTAAKAERIWPS